MVCVENIKVQSNMSNPIYSANKVIIILLAVKTKKSYSYL